MDLKAAIDHIKRSTVVKWKSYDFIADSCPPEAGEMEAAFAAIMNAVADGALAQAAGTFAQGIEAAAMECEPLPDDGWYSAWKTALQRRIRALSPTPPVDASETPVHDRQAGLMLTDATQAPQADPVREAAEMPRAWLDVMDERTRQIAVEGWSPMHDDAHEYGEMAHAAACYTICAAQEDGHEAPPPPAWPWDAGWWKPTDPRRDLVKAGALILAEIERLDRALAQKGEG